MGISNTLLAVALFCALAPTAVRRFHPPERLRHLVISAVVAASALFLATNVVGRIYPLRLFEIMHLAYLLVVVSIPVMLGTWFLASIFYNQRSRLLNVAGGLAVIVGGLGVWGTHIEPNWLATDRITLAADVDQDLRIGVLSDLQTPNVGTIEWEAVATLISEEPDIVLIPGDLYQAPWDTIEANAPSFTALIAELVANVELVAVVSGDSDATGQLAPIVQAAGALYLDNETVDVTVAGQPVRLTGVAVASSQPKRDTIAALGDPTDSLSILLSHRPGITYELPSNSDVDLIVAGHTHGGQIRLPVISDYLWYSDVPPAISAGGLHQLNGFSLYVSTGVGLERHASPQVRFGVRPEVGIIEVIPSTPSPL